MASLLTNSKLGNTGASSLVKSAQTLTKELSTYNDTIAQIKFENSAKTTTDLQNYSSYLNGRINTLESTGSVTDATKALNMRQTIISATHSSASADVQRATIAVLDGQGTNDQKLAAIGDAFQRLYALGDLSAAQAYEQQYYSFSQTVQYQKQQAASALASAAGSYSSSYSSAVTAAETTIKNNIQNANAAFAAQGPSFLDKQTNAYLKDQLGASTNGSASIFAALAGQVGMVNKGVPLTGSTKYSQGTYTPGSMLDIYTQAIVADPSHASSYQAKIDSYLNGATSIALPGDGSKSITYNALMNTVYAGNSGNAPYGLVKSADGGWQVAAEHVSGFTYGKDQNGVTKLMPAYSFFTAPIQGVNPDGSVQKGSVADALKQAGINVKNDSNGDWWFQATNQASFLGKSLGNYPVQGAVQKNGAVEFMTQDGKLLQMVKDDKGLYGLQQLNQFGQVVNANVSGQYGFTPPKSQLVIGSGSTNFMTKVLGDSATPTQVGNKIVYTANGKTYQLVSDAKGLKGLQEVDKNGNIINNNVAGQYGFNPNSTKTGGLSSSTNTTYYDPTTKGQQFAATLASQHEAWVNGNVNATNPNFRNPEGISALSAPWLGVTNIVNNAQMMSSINQVHDQTMAALAQVAAQHQQQLQQIAAANALRVAQVQQQAQLKVAAPAPQPALRVAQASGTSLGGSNVSPQQTANPQSTVNGGSLNQSGKSTGITLSAPTSLPGIRL